MVFSNNLLMGAAGQSTGYEIDQSIRFDKTTSSHLSNTYGSAGNRKTWTFSTWFKRGKIDGTRQSLFAATGHAYLQVGPDAASREMITILNEGSGTDLNWYTTQVFRDPAAWYHLVWQFDTTQADADNRTKLYINGSQVTDFTKAATPAQDFEGAINNAVEHKIGELHIANFYFDGYQAEINFIDGTALAPTAFGEYNNDGVWIPKEYEGAYGDNGFFIDGRDSSDLGDDESGNGNDFASSGLATTDQVTDTPTDNFCVLSPIDKNSNFTLSDGNLTNSNGTNAQAACFGTIAFDASDTNGFYWEVDCGSFQSTGFAVLIADEAVNQTDISAAPTTQPAEGNLWAHRRYKDDNNGGITGVGATGSFADYGPPAVNGNVIGYCVKNGKLFIAINNTWLESSDPATEANPAFSNLTGNLRVGVNRFTDTGTDVTTLNFGQTGFTYTPPTGAKAISTANLATPTIADGSAYFQPVLYTGTTSAFDVTFSGNSDLAPDWLWFKARSAASNHFLFDKIRGVLKTISSDDTTAEVTSTGSMTAFGTDGFSLGDGGSDNDINGVSGTTYVAWGWAANGAGSSNEDGSINTTATSANTTAGFSIIEWSGTGANGTIGHGLGIQPSLFIIKNTATTNSWLVGSTLYAATSYLSINSTDALATGDAAVFNSTHPTSSVINLGSNVGTNGASGTGNMICYAFAEIPGYSSIGSYEGNGNANGSFVYTGFKPAFILTKNIDTTDQWGIRDTTRNPFNVTDKLLNPNASSAETSSTTGYIDILSNGFKARSADSNINTQTIIYMAFAENPFGGDGVAPATAR